MSIFGKKQDSNSSPELEVLARVPSGVAAVVAPPSAPAYGIVEAIQLMRSLPLDAGAQNVELVVRVVRTTLASLNVRVQDIIDDASRRQKSIQEGITALHTQVADLDKQVEGKRREILAQEADLKETTSVKERLLLTERSLPQAPTPPAPTAAATGGPGLFSSHSSLPAPTANARAHATRGGDREDSGHGKAG